MSNRFQGRTPRFDLIDDLIDSTAIIHQRKPPSSNRTYSNYSSLPISLNKTDQSSSSTKLPDRLHLPFARSDSSSIMSNNDERRKELDLLLKHLYDGKLISTINGSHSDAITTTANKQEKENSTNLEAFSLDGDITSLQRELQEREFDIIHLRKEVHDLQSANDQLKSKVPPMTGHSSNNQEIEAIRHEKGVLQHELRTCQEVLAKLQHHNHVHNRSKQIDEAVLQQKEAVEKKLKIFEKQMRILMHENDKYKRHSVQVEGFIEQLKDENVELQEKLNEEKKRSEELFYQEFNALRNDLKSLKQRNNDLFDENLRLQQQQRLKIDGKQRKNRSESPNISETSDSTNYLTTINADQYHQRRSPTTVHRSITMNDNIPPRSIRYHSTTGHEESNPSRSMEFTIRPSKSKRGVAWVDGNFPFNGDVLDDDIVDDSKPAFSQSNHSIYHSMTLTESSNQSRRPFNHDDRRQPQRTLETVSPRRPYAPQSIKEIHLNDTVKFSRPGGKIAKGVVKYIGKLPDKNDQYLGLELDDEESKHDGVYQNQRFFHCKPNKGVFVAFNKVIMAWSER